MTTADPVIAELRRMRRWYRQQATEEGKRANMAAGHNAASIGASWANAFGEVADRIDRRIRELTKERK